MENPYATPSTLSSHTSSLSKDDYDKQVEMALASFKEGHGHITIVTNLRDTGLSQDQAKRESISIFEDAKGKLKKSQLPKYALAGLLVLCAMFVPFLALNLGLGALPLFLAPIIAAMTIIQRLPRPKLIV